VQACKLHCLQLLYFIVTMRAIALVLICGALAVHATRSHIDSSVCHEKDNQTKTKEMSCQQYLLKYHPGIVEEYEGLLEEWTEDGLHDKCRLSAETIAKGLGRTLLGGRGSVPPEQSPSCQVNGGGEYRVDWKTEDGWHIMMHRMERIVGNKNRCECEAVRNELCEDRSFDDDGTLLPDPPGSRPLRAAEAAVRNHMAANANMRADRERQEQEAAKERENFRARWGLPASGGQSPLWQGPS